MPKLGRHTWNISASQFEIVVFCSTLAKAPICPNLDKSDWFKALAYFWKMVNAMLRENTSIIKMPIEGLDRSNRNFCATEVVSWIHEKPDKEFIPCSQKDRLESLDHTTIQGIHFVLYRYIRLLDVLQLHDTAQMTVLNLTWPSFSKVPRPR